MNPSSTAYYSHNWAMGVVQKMEEKYGSSLKVFYKILGINPTILARYLERRDPLFPKLRDFLKVVDKVEKFASPAYRMSEYSSLLSKYSSKFIDERLKARLTAVQAQLILEEQLMKGGESEATADDSLPFVSPLPKVVDDGYGPQLCFRFDEAKGVSA